MRQGAQVLFPRLLCDGLLRRHRHLRARDGLGGIAVGAEAAPHDGSGRGCEHHHCRRAGATGPAAGGELFCAHEIVLHSAVGAHGPEAGRDPIHGAAGAVADDVGLGFFPHLYQQKCMVEGEDVGGHEVGIPMSFICRARYGKPRRGESRMSNVE